MYNNAYQQFRNYNPNNNVYEQNMYDQIDGQIKQLQQMKEQVRNNQMQPAINQTFQLAPTNRDVIRYATSIEEVQKESVIGETPYFSKDMSVVWVKNLKGEIKTYELNEIVLKDEKDIKIDYLIAQIEELKKGQNINERKSNVDEPVTNANESKEPKNVSNISKFTKKAK